MIYLTYNMTHWTATAHRLIDLEDSSSNACLRNNNVTYRCGPRLALSPPIWRNICESWLIRILSHYPKCVFPPSHFSVKPNPNTSFLSLPQFPLPLIFIFFCSSFFLRLSQKSLSLTFILSIILFFSRYLLNFFSMSFNSSFAVVINIMSSAYIKDQILPTDHHSFYLF